MGLRFIFMLTRNDRTVEDALQQLQTALSIGVRHIGFKDIGLPIDELKTLNKAIKDGGVTSYLEVVSLDRDSEIVSAMAAVEIGVDILLGGTRVDDVLPVIKGTGIQYFPFPGRISGHPSVLGGSIEEIVASAQAMATRDGVHGLDLLAYRSREDVPALMKAVCAAVSKPVYVAGSIDTPERIAVVRESGAAGSWTPNVAGDIKQMQVRLAKFEGEAAWSFRQRQDELFFVHRGRLLIRLRDRDEVIEEGEFIVVPHGVEHCPVALDSTCEVLLIDPTPGCVNPMSRSTKHPKSGICD